jgi:hypothetical protein
MTPTREQYELAARAAGGMLYYDTELVVRFIPPGTPPQFNVLSLPQWLPHEDRAQAFSLLCAIGFCSLILGKKWARVVAGITVSMAPAESPFSAPNIEAAAREAIFLCAVEVGRGMG